jgi:hypothetical protein
LAVLWIAVLAVAGVVLALFLPLPSPNVAETKLEQPEPSLSPANAGELCLSLAEDPTDYIGDEALRRRWDLRRASCNMAFAAHPENTHFKVAAARNMPLSQRAESLVLLREAAAQGDAEAYYEIYESHKTWDRGDLDKVPLVTRAEADQALHKAAELGHPFSTQMLAVLLDRGDIVKRDPAGARYWAERAAANPSKGVSRPVGFRHRPLAEPSVRLLPHSAPIRQTCRSNQAASVRTDPLFPATILAKSDSRGSCVL